MQIEMMGLQGTWALGLAAFGKERARGPAFKLKSMQRYCCWRGRRCASQQDHGYSGLESLVA